MNQKYGWHGNKQRCVTTIGSHKCLHFHSTSSYRFGVTLVIEGLGGRMGGGGESSV